VVIETIGGTTLGIAPTTPGYLAAVRKIVDQHEGVLIYDEILSGNYRTSYLMAWHHYQGLTLQNCAPDIAVMGKGITAGYFPMSCVVVNPRIKNVLEEKAGTSLGHTSTNQNHPIGCAAVSAAMRLYDQLRSVMIDMNRAIQIEIAPALRQCKHVQSVQGEGTLWGISLDPERKGAHLKVKEHLFAHGVSAYTDGGTINGKGNMVLFAPPYTTSESELNKVVSAFRSLDLD
jgi:adenosylmethionine-8-amino-7-oxononanoate aminotransferase